MSKKRVYVDFHVIQTVPPSCVNRDDTGSPKTAVYGGVQRARVSSQSWKRAIRLAFREQFDETELGTRTKKIVEMVKDRIMAKVSEKTEEEAMALAEKVINDANVSTKDKETKALFFMSSKQAENLAELAVQGNYDKKDAQKALNANTGIDIALFGRMVAEDPSLNTDASAQVAHAISTHRVDNEFDYFTAVDDLSPADSAGAGMIGTVEYNSATLYRYATVAVHELFGQLAENIDAVAKTVSAFGLAFITAMPTGKQNTFANRTLPDGVIVTVRTDQPVNFAGAFETPAFGENGGYVQESIRKLIDYALQVNTDYCDAPKKSWAIGHELSALGELKTLSGLLEALEKETRLVFSES